MIFKYKVPLWCHVSQGKAIVEVSVKVHSRRYGTVYPKKYAHGFCFAVLCCGYTLTDFPISIRLTSLALWQSNDCPSASKATLMNMDKYLMWIHYERLRNHNKAKHNKTVCIFLLIYCMVNNELKWRKHISSTKCKYQIVSAWLSRQDIASIYCPGSQYYSFIYTPRCHTATIFGDARQLRISIEYWYSKRISQYDI